MLGFTLYSFTLGFFLPCIAIFLFYILVLCRLRRVGPKNKSKEKRRSHRKVTYLVLTVIAIYVICWLPYWLGQLYLTFIAEENLKSSLVFLFLLLASCLSYINSAVNPILYGMYFPISITSSPLFSLLASFSLEPSLLFLLSMKIFSNFLVTFIFVFGTFELLFFLMFAFSGF